MQTTNFKVILIANKELKKLQGVAIASLFGGRNASLPCVTLGYSYDVIEIEPKPFCKFMILMIRRWKKQEPVTNTSFGIANEFELQKMFFNLANILS
jgi:hypothetical protein